MEKKVFITEEEKEKCKKVAEAFAEMEEYDCIILDLGRYGFVKLSCYEQNGGFAEMDTFVNSRELFDTLYEEWFAEQLILLSKDNPMRKFTLDEVYQCLPIEKKQELLNKKNDFAEKAEMVL